MKAITLTRERVEAATIGYSGASPDGPDRQTSGRGRLNVEKDFRADHDAALLFSATVTFVTPVQAKRHAIRRWHGYGFLPGWRSPEQIEWERAQNRGPTCWYGGPRLLPGALDGWRLRRRSAMSGIAVDRDRDHSWSGSRTILTQSNGLNANAEAGRS
jgi:hypothetical protein